MSVYLDTITLLMGLGLLIPYSKWIIKNPSKWSVLGFFSLSLYLLAQIGWTTSWMSGYEWGRDISNYIWFSFNTLVCVLLYYIWKDKA